MTSGIYKIENTINGKIYIGCSKDIEKRFKQHRLKSKNNSRIPTTNKIKVLSKKKKVYND